MFKMFYIYPIALLVIFCLASDINISASIYSLKDNHISIEFPKASLRSSKNPDPWYSFSWNMKSAFD